MFLRASIRDRTKFIEEASELASQENRGQAADESYLRASTQDDIEQAMAPLRERKFNQKLFGSRNLLG